MHFALYDALPGQDDALHQLSLTIVECHRAIGARGGQQSSRALLPNEVNIADAVRLVVFVQYFLE